MKNRQVYLDLDEFRIRLNFVQWLAVQQEREEFAFKVCELTKWLSRVTTFSAAINDLVIQKSNFDAFGYRKISLIEEKAQSIIKRIISKAKGSNRTNLSNLFYVNSAAWIFMTQRSYLKQCTDSDSTKEEIDSLANEADALMSFKERMYKITPWGRWSALNDLLLILDGNYYSDFNNIQLQIIDSNYFRFVSFLHSISEFILEFAEKRVKPTLVDAKSSTVWNSDFRVEGGDFVFGEYGRLQPDPTKRPDIGEEDRSVVTSTRSLQLLELFQLSHGEPIPKSEICTKLGWNSADVDSALPYLRSQLIKLSGKSDFKANISVLVEGDYRKKIVSVRVVPKTDLDKNNKLSTQL